MLSKTSRVISSKARNLANVQGKRIIISSHWIILFISSIWHDYLTQVLLTRISQITRKFSSYEYASHRSHESHRSCIAESSQLPSGVYTRCATPTARAKRLAFVRFVRFVWDQNQWCKKTSRFSRDSRETKSSWNGNIFIMRFPCNAQSQITVTAVAVSCHRGDWYTPPRWCYCATAVAYFFHRGDVLISIHSPGQCFQLFPCAVDCHIAKPMIPNLEWAKIIATSNSSLALPKPTDLWTFAI